MNTRRWKAVLLKLRGETDSQGRVETSGTVDGALVKIVLAWAPNGHLAARVERALAGKTLGAVLVKTPSVHKQAKACARILPAIDMTL